MFLYHAYHISPKLIGEIKIGWCHNNIFFTMGFQVQAATWALDRGVTVVICNGMQEKAIKTILAGRKIGTFFTDSSTGSTSVEVLAENGK